MQILSRRSALTVMGGAGLAVLSGCRGATRSAAAAEPGQQAQTGRPTTRQAPANEPTTRQAPSGAPGAGGDAGPGRSEREIQVGGVARRYIRYEPAGLDPAAPAPLVLVLHGATGSGAIAERLYDFRAQSDAHGFVVAYPDALGSPSYWNSSPQGLTGQADDVGFLRALVDREGSVRPIDPVRTFVCGHSSGALMAYRLAGEAADLFPAVGIVAGSIGYRGPNGRTLTIPTPASPVSVIHFHGTDDTLVPYNGGSRRGGEGGVISVADSIAFWVAVDGCDPTPATTETVGVSHRETYSGGQAGSEVTLWTIQGGGHGWPKVSGRASVGVSPSGIAATELIWQFFAGHTRR
jgi:polyhydroxybutyrate depolymerase